MGFKLRHYSYKNWADKQSEGFRASTFSTSGLPYPATETADKLLWDAYDTLFAYIELSEKTVVIAKVTCGQKPYALLQADRDYFVINLVDGNERKTVAAWQSASLLKGYKIYELWCNMARLIEENLP